MVHYLKMDSIYLMMMAELRERDAREHGLAEIVVPGDTAASPEARNPNLSLGLRVHLMNKRTT